MTAKWLIIKRYLVVTNNMTLVRLACKNKISRYFIPLFENPARLDYVLSARGVVARARGVDDGAALL